MTVLIVDYGMGNLGSVLRSLEVCGANAIISDDPRDIKQAIKIVLPGVGAFVDGINCLQTMGWDKAIKDCVLNEGIPLLGICLGMQLLADKSYEGQEANGLGLIPGEIRRLESQNRDERIPHVGWNIIVKDHENCLFDGIPDGSDFYFVHSYHFMPSDTNDILTTTPYCGGFVSSIQHKNIYGVQFHPEKSSRFGMKLISNFLEL